MMNPQYPPPGQNNNAPNNPLGFPPTSQDYNGVSNPNLYGPTAPSGAPGMKPFDQNSMAQEMQNMNLNGPQGFTNIPSSQLPPSQYPPGSTSSGFAYNHSAKPPGGMPPRQFTPDVLPHSSHPPVGQNQPMPPSSTPAPQPGFEQMPPASQGNRQPQGAPTAMPPKPMGQQGQLPHGAPGSQMPPNSQAMGQNSFPGPQGQMPPHSQPGFPPQQMRPPQMDQQKPGMPQQMGPGPQSQSGMPPQMRPGQPGMPPSQMQPGLAPQGGFTQNRGPNGPGMPPQPGLPSQPQMPQSGPMPGQQGFPKPGHQPGLPPQPGQQQPGLPPQPGQQQPGLPSQPGLQQQGLPPQPGQQQSRLPPQPAQPQPGMPPFGHGQMPPNQQIGQPGLPPGPQGSQPGLPPQPGPPSQPGLPPQPGSQHPGLPPQPGFAPQPGNQGLPPQPGFQSQGLPPQPPMSQAQYNQGQTLPGLPHMPPPHSQQRQFPGQPPQPGYGQPPVGPPGAQYPGMQPMPGQQMPGQQMPGQMPGQPMPGQMPGQQMPGQIGYQQQPGYQPGYPPFPAQQPSYGAQYQQPQQKRLDPDQMPSPIQVMADDQQNRGGVFLTNDKGLVPPLVTTDFTVDDKGNSSPRYIRSSMYSVPVTADLLKQTSMPFCLIISPMADPVGTEVDPPVLDFAALTGSPAMGPVRCCRCKAYMCPNMKFIDSGRHFKCAFCKATTEVPMEYTQYINSMQQYGRVPAEMALGTYEIIATKEYCRENKLPNPPAVVFLIDVSYNAVKNGLLQTVCDNILDVIQTMPKDEQTGKSWTRVGFITYSSTVHFYNIKGTLAQPQMLSVGDVGDMFVPLLEGFLVTAEDSGPVLQQLLQQLPALFHDNKETETILLPAVQAGLEALKAAETCGQLIVFHTSLPTYNAPGKLINREDRKLLGTDKEKQILAPQTTAYNELGQACSAAGVCVDMFVCNNSYVDAATIGQLPRLTGGQINKYTYFTADTDGWRVMWDVRRAVGRRVAHDAVMRVRTSTGVRATDFVGHFFMSNTTDVELAAVDADKGIGVEIKHDDKLTGEDGVYIQAALLYTHRSGQRRLRVLNLSLGVAHQLADVYRSAELDTCVAYLTKQAVWAGRESTPRAVREALSARCARSLAAYRRHCASPSSAGQLVLPESMKLLPLYTSCLLRSDAVAGGPDITCDDRSCAQYRALTADVSRSVVYTYPRLLPLHVLPAPPTPHRASVDKLHERGAYLLENGVHMLIWVGSQAPAEWVQDVFGVPSAQHVDTQVCELPRRDNPTSQAVVELLEDARKLRQNAMRLTVMRQHDKLEAVLRHFLVEDRGVDGSSSYVDYLCHIHKEIRALL